MNIILLKYTHIVDVFIQSIIIKYYLPTQIFLSYDFCRTNVWFKLFCAKFPRFRDINIITRFTALPTLCSALGHRPIICRLSIAIKIVERVPEESEKDREVNSSARRSKYNNELVGTRINYTSYFERFILHYFNYQYLRWVTAANLLYRRARHTRRITRLRTSNS